MKVNSLQFYSPKKLIVNARKMCYIRGSAISRTLFGGVKLKVKKVQKKKYKNKAGITNYNSEIIGIVILALGVLISLSMYFDNSIGLFGKFIKSLLLGFMGWPSLLIPPVIIFYSVLVIFKKNCSGWNLKILYISVLMLLISAIVQTGYYKEEDYVNMSAFSSIRKFYTDGTVYHGGGILGGIISIPFLLVFRNLGTIIILATIAIIDIILITNISIADIAIRLKEAIVALFVRIKEALKVSDKEKTESFQDLNECFEPDIVMNGRKIPKILDFNKKKATKENTVQNSKVGQVQSNEKIDNSDQIDNDQLLNDQLINNQLLINGKLTIGEQNSIIETMDSKAQFKKDSKLKVGDIKAENDKVDFIVDDLKKSGSAASVEKITDSLNREISQKPKIKVEYKYPHTGLLEENNQGSSSAADFRNAALRGAKKLEETLKSFGVDAKVINVSMGPAVTRYELQPSPGVKVSKIVNLADDISLNLAASGVRIEAPIPGKAAIGIEVPNKEVVAVFLKDVIDSKNFKDYPSKLAFALGKDISGQSIVTDIAKMPHVLIAGATGSGKSVCINSLIISLLFKASPDEVKLLMVDPKVVELGIYNGIPHLLIPVVTEPKKAAGALNWAVQEMVNRYKLFADNGVRDIKGYNAMVKEKGEGEALPQIVIIIDELADLMMVAPNDVEDAICRLAQMARAAGMHLVIATQRPSVDVITGIIKANVPSRIAFAVSSQVDSRTILDMAGAEKLLGKGDMLFYPVGEPKPIRVKGAFVTDKEVEKVVEYVKQQGSAEYNEDIIEEINNEKEPEQNDSGDNDELLTQAIELVVDAGQASVSLIQRKFKVGYARAARIVDQMEARGIVGGFEGSKPRQVLITRQQWQELNMRCGSE